MPVYELKCKSCKHEFSDYFMSAEIDLSDIECPACTRHEVEKLMSMFASGTRTSKTSAGHPVTKSCTSSHCPPGCRCH